MITSVLITAIALMAALPVVGLVVLGLRVLWLRLHPPHAWLWLWSISLILVIIPALSHSPAEGLLIFGQFLLVVVIAISMRAPRQVAVSGFAIALFILAFSGVLERKLSAYVWEGPGTQGLFPTLQSVLLKQNNIENHGVRSWSLSSSTGALELSFEARQLGGQAGWNWFRSDNRFQLASLEEDGELFTRVVTPIGPDPYLMRTFDMGEPIAGRTFQVSLEMRSPTPVVPLGCRGVWLMVWYQGADAKCLAVELDSEWQAFSLEWTVPETSTTSVIRIILNDLDSITYDVRRVQLVEITPEGPVHLHPLFPEAATLVLSQPGSTMESESGINFVPEHEWRSYRILVKQPDATIITATLFGGKSYGGDLVVAVRNTELQDLSEAAIDPYPLSTVIRQSFWTPHPNLAGHMIATFGLALLSLTRAGWLGFGGFILTLFSLWLTGSRAAWVAALPGLLWLFWHICHPRTRRWIFPTLIIGAVCVLLVIGIGGLGRFRVLGVEELTARPVIWQAAWQAFQDNPWIGIGSSNFISYFQAYFTGVSNEVVTHAHNLWLAFASSYGVFGLLAALWLSVGLLYIAWHWGRWRGLALVIPVLVMNIFDYTLFFAGVLLPLIFALNVMREQKMARSSSDVSFVAQGEVAHST